MRFPVMSVRDFGLNAAKQNSHFHRNMQNIMQIRPSLLSSLLSFFLLVHRSLTLRFILSVKESLHFYHHEPRRRSYRDLHSVQRYRLNILRAVQLINKKKKKRDSSDLVMFSQRFILEHF